MFVMAVRIIQLNGTYVQSFRRRDLYMEAYGETDDILVKIACVRGDGREGRKKSEERACVSG